MRDMRDLLKINGATIRKGEQAVELTAVELRQLVSVLDDYAPRVPMGLAHRPILIPDRPQRRRPGMEEMEFTANGILIGEGFSVEIDKEPISEQAVAELRSAGRAGGPNRG
jgi:hypothetical protein